ncbi:serine/threonine-protein kinase [Conexibacter sp. SYSU D00693]|uniref:serine/threonine-protein kinase n=1 Tax=Conexibacter sp. SYSU D00693 TaxID=2812560 RepID=UPI00196B9A0F|nr:serine/threonine-protein kinase [Conexibacter sp. SYSU D00693]
MPPAAPSVSLPDRYRVVRHIANGGMATVWAAEDELLGRLVAVKVLGPGYAADPDARRRFTREARAAARVSDHPHVVTIYDIGEHEGEAFIVMEHLAGGTVGQRLRAPQPVPVPMALQWLEEAASALDAAHAAEIVHRDVKPGNLLLDERGRLAVGDFGIASIQGESALTMAGQVVGTAAYLSPEQGRGEPATPASDRYALAVVAYELLCGRRPFEGDTPVAQVHQHVHAEPPEPEGVCASAADALRHGLAKDPRDRPHSAAAFVAELRRSIGDAAEAPTAVTAISPLPVEVREPRTPTPRPPRRPPAPVPAPAGHATGSDPVAPRHATGSDPERAGGGRRLPVLLATALALGAVVAIVAAALGGGGGDDGATRAGDGDRTAARTSSSERPRTSSRATQTQSSPAPAAEPKAETQAQEPDRTASDGRSPAELNDAGFALLPGDPNAAIPLLQRSVTGFREDGRTSEQPYAFALYNLGWALRLAGRPDEAIPYLEERLNYPDNTGDAKRELDRARAEAGGGTGDGGDEGGATANGTRAGKPGKGRGLAKGFRVQVKEG